MTDNFKQPEQKDSLELKKLFDKMKRNRNTLIKSAIIAFSIGVFFVH